MNYSYKTVFVFGAGSSADDHCPTMSDFVKKSSKIMMQFPLNNNDGVEINREAFEDVYRAIDELKTVNYRSNLQIENIEVLFGAVEMGNMIGSFIKRDSDSFLKLKRSMITFIVQTLELSMPIPTEINGNYVKCSAPMTYNFFAKTIKEIINEASYKNFYDFSFITFNYDLGLDIALANNGLPFEYCLGNEIDPKAFPYLKLHGSINWDNVEGNIIPKDVQEENYHLWSNPKYVYNQIGSGILRKRTEENDTPFILPPTWNKSTYQKQIRFIWKKAADEFAQAHNIFIIGYSLPETDMFFRYLLALGSNSLNILNKIVIVNCDKKVEEKFRNLFAQNQQPKISFYESNFQSFLGVFKGTFQNI